MNENKNQDERQRKLRLVERYDSDDHSRFAGPDYEERPFEIGEEDFSHSAHTHKENIHIRPEGNWNHPGVSGKADDGETWVNEKEYEMQTDFTGYGPRNYKRSDDRIYEEVCEALMKHRDIDATNIGVRVQDGVVFLTGKVSSRQMKKNSEFIIEDLPGVQDVRNELTIIHKTQEGGPDSATRKDLGI